MGLGNYSISYATRAAGLTVTPRPLVIAADPLGRVYGDANPALTYTTGGRGLAGGDVLSGALATSATMASGVGSYAITLGTLGADANYAVSYAGANLTVMPRPLTITAGLLTRLFGDALRGGLTTAATQASAPGAYQIALGSLAAPPNYAVTFVPGTLTVEPPRIVAAGGRAGTQQRDSFATDPRRTAGPDRCRMRPGRTTRFVIRRVRCRPDASTTAIAPPKPGPRRRTRGPVRPCGRG